MSGDPVKIYLRQVFERIVKEWVFWLGLASTIASFFPQMQPTWAIRPVGGVLLAVGFLRANYLIWKDLHHQVVSEGEQRQRFLEIVVRLVEQNVSAASGSTKGYQAALLNDGKLELGDLVRFVPDPYCREDLVTFLGKIQSAKAIYRALQGAHLGPYVHPEQIAIEDLCREIREVGTRLLKRLVCPARVA